ncbi:6-carboxy-5,6,7,8-tetrahydropterin synthase [Planctomycetes bacterium Pla163]|jgi:6-pyruvoyltetrahydropterin/6-carboxytetrahydropterin synthase|uniref:6-carboxy-5,6,7,8-tetrahydropterin synthase n=1 Tax=Rohdeia mirabilis TaxID=2528008 RepID=A0A518D451_9BACT|nr:6-carboxy-5,6,7,8-tetrahydropterin synthase [Planctomycetes bacterium Pla163]
MSRATSITCRYRFSAAHVLRREELSEEDNRVLFGPCARRHGHNYELEVTVGGPVDGHSGMVMNFTVLDALVRERVLDAVDHYDLDADVPWLVGVLTTAENLVEVFWQRLADPIAAAAPGARLARLRLFETVDAWVDHTG